MSTGDSMGEKPFVAEATEEDGRAFVPRSKRPKNLEQKFEPRDHAWLQDEDDEYPAIQVTIVAVEKKRSGSFVYQVKDRHTQQLVKNDDGTTWFAEAQLSVGKPIG